MIKTAVVGAGYWGKNLLRVFQELGALHAICESNPDNPNLKPYKTVKLYTNYIELLSDASIEAVAIASPAVTHYEMAKKALEFGKDVYVEKPLALTAAEGKELVDIADNKKQILMVGHILQYHPAVIKLREMISAGTLGKVEYIYSNRLNIGKLRTEENILWSFAPHDISVILSLLNEEPVSVIAFGGDYLNKGVYDTTLTTMEFPNGVKSHIFVSWLHPYKEQKLIVVGSEAMAVFDDMSKEKLFLYPHKIEWKEGKIPVAQKAEYQVVSIEKAEPLKEELEHFIGCARNRKRPLTDGHEGLRVLKILQSAEDSLKVNNSSIAVHPSETLKSSSPSYFVNESAYIDEGAEIGEGTKIWHFSHILKGSRIGRNCVIGQNVAIGPDVTIGNNCKVQNNVSLYRGVILEDEVFCGPSCVFTNVYTPRAFVERKKEFMQTVVKRGATIGANATLVCGITIGKYAMVGAGAVVKTDVLDYAIVAGVPARQIGWTCKCGTSLHFSNHHAACKYCRSEYALDEHKIIIIKEEI
ncbi:MAG: Gfo/Idh/MocA family oxidoreductase [Thermodesulfovibrionales bacterium]|nr:Gfo/Idh/MocA family oxidoreductase [Thermodesulfovibrionales bacterium]